MGNGWVGPNWDPPNEYAAEIDWEWMADDPTPEPRTLFPQRSTPPPASIKGPSRATPRFQPVLFFKPPISGLAVFQSYPRFVSTKNTSDLTKTWSCLWNPGDSWWFPVLLWSFPSAKKTKKSCQSAKSDSKVAPTQIHRLKRWGRKKKTQLVQNPPQN